MGQGLSDTVTDFRMIQQMMAQSRIQETVHAWTPPEFYDDTPVENAWRSWAHSEMAKRCVLLKINIWQ